MSVLLFFFLPHTVSQQAAEAAPIFDFNSNFTQDFAIDVLKVQGEAIGNFMSHSIDKAKNVTTSDVIDFSKKVKDFLPLWAWILIGVIILLIAILCICPVLLLMILKCCGVLWCFGFRSVGVVAGSCAACWQSVFYGGYVAAGSLFSLCQAVAMR